MWLEGQHWQQQVFQQLQPQQQHFQQKLQEEQQHFMLCLLDQGKPSPQVGATIPTLTEGGRTLTKMGPDSEAFLKTFEQVAAMINGSRFSRPLSLPFT